MKNKVLILSSVHRWDDTRIFHKQAKSLAKLYDVELHAIADFKHKIINGINVYGHKRGLRLFPLRIWFQYLIVALRSDSKTVHFHDPDLIFLGVFLRIFGKIVIYDVHEDFPAHIHDKVWIPKIFRWPIAFILDILEKISSVFFSSVIVVTDKIASRFKHRKIILVQNYPMIDSIPRKTNYKDAGEKLSVIYLGVITHERGILEILKSTFLHSQPTNYDLKLVGSIPHKDLEESIKNLISKSPLEIIHKSLLPYDGAMEELKNADIGLVCFYPAPNNIESLPNKMFEYLLAGLPVICSNFPIWKDLIEKNNCGISVNPLNPIEITNAIQYLYTNPEELKIMGMNGRKLVEERFNWENEERKLLKLYNKLIK